METEVMTVRQVLEITVNNLGQIAVPRALNNQIGIPIDNAIQNIQLCIDAMDVSAKSELKVDDEINGNNGTLHQNETETENASKV